MIDLAEVQFDCLNAIFESGLLCEEKAANGTSLGVFKAYGSPSVGPDHKGWARAVVNALYVMKLLDRTPMGEFKISHKGKSVCLDIRQAKSREAVIRAAQEDPDKIVLMSEFRKGA